MILNYSINLQSWREELNCHVSMYYYSGFPKETPELKFRLSFFFRSATVCKSLTRMRDDLTLMRPVADQKYCV